MSVIIFLTLLLSIAVGEKVLTAADVDVESAAEQIVDSTNEFRQERQLAKLQTERNLQTAAQKFADFMAESKKYGHHADGRTPAERVEAAGYSYCVVRENIAYRTNPDELDASQLATKFTQGWIDSPEHRENMLAEFVTETAVAIATADGTTFFAVQLFGRPESDSYNVELKNETQSTWTVRMKSGGNSDEMELPANSILKMKRCLPTTLQIVGTDSQLKVTRSTEMAIRPSDSNAPNLVELSE